MTRIHATGTGESHYRAERATITAHISVVSRDRGRAIAEATRLHRSVMARAEQLRASGDATWHAGDALDTWTQKSFAEGTNQQVVIEHRTSGRVRIKLSNLDLVGALVDEFAQAGLGTSVEWALTEASRRQFERHARKRAVDEARAVADDYAEALGRRIVEVISISDGPTTTPMTSPRFAAKAMSADGAAEATVREITVSATVSGEYETD